jgi:hypothetical protein
MTVRCVAEGRVLNVVQSVKVSAISSPPTPFYAGTRRLIHCHNCALTHRKHYATLACERRHAGWMLLGIAVYIAGMVLMILGIHDVFKALRM